MQAWRIQDDHTLKLDDAEAPEPGTGQVRIAVRAVGVNRADIMQTQGLYPAPRASTTACRGWNTPASSTPWATASWAGKWAIG